MEIKVDTVHIIEMNGKSFELEHEEARTLYNELRKVFGDIPITLPYGCTSLTDSVKTWRGSDD